VFANCLPIVCQLFTSCLPIVCQSFCKCLQSFCKCLHVVCTLFASCLPFCASVCDSLRLFETTFCGLFANVCDHCVFLF
jgi:hypothetical protein